MRQLVCLLLICFTFYSAPTVQAQEFDGMRFLRACGATVKQQDGANVTNQEMLESLLCIGYVQGFTDSIAIAQTVSGNRLTVCLPKDGVVIDQSVRVFVKYLRDNPKILHESGRVSLYVALVQAFPCK
jgi:hypothetical protein